MALSEAQKKEIYTTKYAKKFVTALQQEVSRLRGCVNVTTGIVGNLYRVPVSGLRDFQESSDGKGSTPDVASVISTRWIAPKFYDDGEIFDRNFSYLSENADGEIDRTHQAMVAAAGRKLDDVIIAAATGIARSGEAGNTNVAFPTAQKIAVDYYGDGVSSGSKGLTFAKIRKAKAMLKKAEAYKRGDELFLMLGADDIMNLLADDHATSAEFQQVKSLDNGEIDRFMGFKIIHTERLTVNAGTPKTKDCLAWTKSAIHLALWSEMKFELGIRSDKKNCQQAYSCFSAGACRVLDAGVVAITTEVPA